MSQVTFFLRHSVHVLNHLLAKMVWTFLCSPGQKASQWPLELLGLTHLLSTGSVVLSIFISTLISLKPYPHQIIYQMFLHWHSFLAQFEK